MASRNVCILATLLLCFWPQGSCQQVDGPTTIIVTPATLTLTPNASDSIGGRVTVHCRASSLGQGENLLAMTIQRVLHTDPEADPETIARATASQGSATLTIQAPQGSSVSGSLGERTITLTLTRANCGDTGQYICSATAMDASFSTRQYESQKNITIQVSPGSIAMMAEPFGVSNWRVNDTLRMRCNGIVGTVLDDTQVQWVWEYQDADRLPGVDNWKSYGGIGDPDTDIHTDPVYTTNPCYNRQISELTRRLTVSDTGRQYRCYVINRDVSSDSADLAQVYPVGIVTEPALRDTAAPRRNRGDNRKPYAGIDDTDTDIRTYTPRAAPAADVRPAN